MSCHWWIFSSQDDKVVFMVQRSAAGRSVTCHLERFLQLWMGCPYPLTSRFGADHQKGSFSTLGLLSRRSPGATDRRPPRTPLIPEIPKHVVTATLRIMEVMLSRPAPSRLQRW